MTLTNAPPRWALSCAAIRCYHEFRTRASALRIKAVLDAAGLDARVETIPPLEGGVR